MGRSVAKVKELLARPGPGLVFAMIQRYREVDADLAGEASGAQSTSEEKEPFGLLNESDAIVVLVDEAHRSQASTLHANLLQRAPELRSYRLHRHPDHHGREEAHPRDLRGVHRHLHDPRVGSGRRHRSDLV